MKNIALVSELTRNIPGVYVGRVEEGTFYELSLEYEGEGTLRFWIANENNAAERTVINRNCDMLTRRYSYPFTAPHSGIVTYHIKDGKAKNIQLNEFTEGDQI